MVTVLKMKPLFGASIVVNTLIINILFTKGIVAAVNFYDYLSFPTEQKLWGFWVFFLVLRAYEKKYSSPCAVVHHYIRKAGT